eukprot:EC122459.1.p1 GENE.EC122459.1~~EC122459.1.p1  ORF type:complete len:117 (+),score=16.43 EC122459.1:212-562(+)
MLTAYNKQQQSSSLATTEGLKELPWTSFRSRIKSILGKMILLESIACEGSFIHGCRSEVPFRRSFFGSTSRIWPSYPSMRFSYDFRIEANYLSGQSPNGSGSEDYDEAKQSVERDE